MSIWITEYGYQTRPPDPLAGVSPKRQGPLTTWGEFMAFRNPRVASIAQFLFVDDKPKRGYSERSPKRWITWQSGLIALDGRPKPFLRDYPLPLHLAREGAGTRVFGGYRPGPGRMPLTARIEYSRGDRRWLALRTVPVRNRRGYLSTTVTAPGPGLLRILWRDPIGGGQAATTPAQVP